MKQTRALDDHNEREQTIWIAGDNLLRAKTGRLSLHTEWILKNPSTLPLLGGTPL